MSEKIVTLSNLAEFKTKCDEKYAGLEIGDIINLGQLMSDGTLATFSKSITKDEYDAIPDSGLAIIMFNTTCQILPYTKAQANRFVCNAIYNGDGDSMVARGKLEIVNDDVNQSIRLSFDSQFSDAVTSLIPKPYGIIRFIGL